MRKLILTGAATLAACGLLAATAGAAQTAHFSVAAIQTSGHNTNHGGFVFTERLRRHHHVIGHDRVACRKAARRGLIRCKAVFFFPRGKVKAQGNYGSGNNKLAVVGGTRVFDGVSGKLLVHGGGGKKSRLEFLLVR